MKKQLKLKSIALFLLTAVFITSCSDDNSDINPGEGGESSMFDGELSVFETGTDNRTVNINGANVTGADALVKVSFQSSNSMRRLYVTQDVSDFGAEPFEFAVTGITVDDKKDGSLDLSSASRNAFDFEIPFPIPTSADSKIVYTLWATTGRGDFRDISKRNAISDTALGTITITGSGNTVGNGVKSFSNIKLEAPAADGTSMTFFSFYTGEVYKINPFNDAAQNAELVEIWDLGYYYTPVGNELATLASVQEYNLPGVDISAISGIDRADFNQTFFKTSSLTEADFNSITSAQLNALTVSTSDSEKLNGLAEGNIIEFQDKYGNKGLIKITTIDLGARGNGFDADAFIELDAKVLN
ncbi:hypothetical protein [uncultured Algibacter sp.]|uniref:hypothetical protein n=1 Tax=uncultured Algibacter sp. TaxID=298659 RepID=UPI00321796C8